MSEDMLKNREGTPPFTWQRGVVFGCLALLFGFLAYFAFRWPVYAGDTDIWFHMSGGRYLFDLNQIPASSYFSFIEPAKEWVNYYWLFQAFVYKVFSFSGYEGLIISRAIFLLATMGVICFFLLRREASPERLLYFWALVVVFVLIMVPRFQWVRPHMLSYLFIVVFLFVLEYRPRWAFILPFVGVVWCNVHGVEYPVMVLICLAYLLELFVSRVRNKGALGGPERNLALILVLTAWTVMLTPSGRSLFTAPFSTAANVQHFIIEMRPISRDALFDVHWNRLYLEGYSPMNLALFLACLSTVRGLWSRRIRPAHFIVFAGGLYLMTRGVRFYWEATLLALPVLKAHPLFDERNISRRAALSVGRSAIMLFFGFMPLYFLWHYPANALRKPMSYNRLPDGAVDFLKTRDTGGTILNYPGTGGYLNWELYPRYRIYMDLQMSIFDAQDYFRVWSAFGNNTALEKMIETYEPDYILVQITNGAFPEVLKAAEVPYVVVFFDDAEVLLVHRERKPQVAQRYGFRVIDPFGLIGMDIGSLTEEQRLLLVRELQRIDALYGDIALVNQTIAVILNSEGKYQQAIPYADHLISITPEQATGYSIKGDALLGLESWDAALQYYTEALERPGAEAERVYRKIWYTENRLGNSKEAYEAAQKAMNPFATNVSVKDHYEYGLTAFQAEDYTTARMVFRFAALKVDKDDVEWKRRIDDVLQLFEEDGSEDVIPSGIEERLPQGTE